MRAKPDPKAGLCATATARGRAALAARGPLGRSLRAALRALPHAPKNNTRVVYFALGPLLGLTGCIHPRFVFVYSALRALFIRLLYLFAPLGLLCPLAIGEGHKPGCVG